MVERLLARVALSSALVFVGLAGAEASRQPTRSVKHERSPKVESPTNAEAAASSRSERECLARAMYFESNRSHEDGMLAVGTIVANRLESGRYGSTICEVVGSRSQFAPGVLSRAMTETRPAERARRVADAVLNGRRHPLAGTAQFFHTANVPFRNDDKTYVLVSGGNAFYQWNRGGDDQAARANLDSFGRAIASAEEDREVGAKVVDAALRPKLSITPPLVVPDAAPPQPTPLVGAGERPTRVAEAAPERRVPDEIVARPAPLSEVLAYRDPAVARTPAATAALDSVAGLSFGRRPARTAPAAVLPIPVAATALPYGPRPASATPDLRTALAIVAAVKSEESGVGNDASAPRVIAPSAPVLASAAPVAAPAAQKSTSQVANIVVAQVWALLP